MGYNTTVVVMNDSLDFIERDNDFGRNIAAAIRRVMIKGTTDVKSLNAANAATVIETHHADGIALCAIGGNYGAKLAEVWYCGDITSTEGKVKILKQFAAELGYTIRKKAR